MFFGLNKKLITGEMGTTKPQKDQEPPLCREKMVRRNKDDELLRVKEKI